MKRAYPDLATYFQETGTLQVHVARECGTTPSTISKIIRGDMVPRPVLALRIARYCNVPLDSFQRVYLATRRTA